MVKDKNSWGGKRTGTGRSKTDEASKSYTFRLPKELADMVDQHENKLEFIRFRITNFIHQNQNIWVKYYIQQHK